MRLLWLTLIVSSLGLSPSGWAAEREPLELRLWDGPAAQAPPAPTADASRDDERYRGPSDDRWLTGVTDPVLSVYLPDAERATGAAIVVLPGGGYRGLAIDKEGHYVARWLAERGVVGVVVPYRCGDERRRHPVPRDDARRALQQIRSRSAAWGVDPGRVGVLGFSAGGHLAATVATRWLDADPGADDPALRRSSRPDFAVLVYPVISLRPEVSHGASLNNLLGESPTAEQIAALSADERVTAETPPTLLIHSADDEVVPVANAERFYDACRRHGVPVEMHLYETGGHGYGMWAERGSVAGWPAVLERWLAARGLSRE